MEIKDRLLAQVKWNYLLIYDWLIENGILKIEKAKADDPHWTAYDDKKHAAYREEIKNLANPKLASLVDIEYVARLVVSGLFERHFMEKAGDFILGQIGRHILSMIDEIKQLDVHIAEQENILDSTNTIFEIDADYFEAAEGIYSKTFIDNERNIGGRVALADTNWEFQKLAGDTGKTLFRNAHQLKFAEIDEADNLFLLTINNQIHITSITVV